MKIDKLVVFYSQGSEYLKEICQEFGKLQELLREYDQENLIFRETLNILEDKLTSCYGEELKSIFLELTEQRLEETSKIYDFLNEFDTRNINLLGIKLMIKHLLEINFNQFMQFAQLILVSK